MMLARIIENLWCTLVQVYKEYSVESSIHGIKYTTTAKSTSARFFWVIVLILCVLAARDLAFLFYKRHESASMSTLIISDHFPSWALSLPAITLCSGSIAVTQKVVPYLTSQKRIYMPRGLTRVEFENSITHLRESVYPKNHYPDELDNLQQILSANRLSLLELFEGISPNCSDLLIMCRFEGNTVPCDELLRPVVTPYGICCSFNYENPKEILRGSKKPSKTYRSVSYGKNFGLSVVMKSFPSVARTSSTLHGDGVKVMIHERHTEPNPTVQEFVAATGYETVARFRGTRLISSSEILSLPPRMRGCYSSSKNAIYRADNCYEECRRSAIRKLCGCRAFFESNNNADGQVCDLSHIPCLARIILFVYRLTQQDPECDCLPDCESTTYKVTVTSLPLSTNEYNPRRLYKEARRYPNSIVLHFTLSGQTAILQRRELILSRINLVSSLGGVFSLFLGGSFISIVEIIYFFCILFVKKLRNNRIVVTDVEERNETRS